MQAQLYIYNTLTRRKELFQPIAPPHVGFYVCGPTVYGDAHLGHARTFVVFDTIIRYLRALEYKVRYVRNITDVGHLENDADEGEDRIIKKARLEAVEPMQIAQRYTVGFAHDMAALNVLPPDIEPRASGHIIEQIKMIVTLLEKGFAYQSNGSVYFSVEQYNKKYHYGQLSGRKVDELLTETRELQGTDEKRSPLDFALWKRADEAHIMRWPSPWSEGYPGWHIECSAMGTKYLGAPFDIHGGGMDLLFPHHECELAQTSGSTGIEQPVNYWLYTNMLTINGQKMGRSLGNFINLNQLFSGDHQLLERGYHPNAVRYMILQAHYRSTLDFSNEALTAATKGAERLAKAALLLNKLQASGSEEGYRIEVHAALEECKAAMSDDFNSAKVIAALQSLAAIINKIYSGETVSVATLEVLRVGYSMWYFDVLGLRTEEANGEQVEAAPFIELLLQLRKEAKENKDYALADSIRAGMSERGISINDGKEGSSWESVKN